MRLKFILDNTKELLADGKLLEATTILLSLGGNILGDKIRKDLKIHYVEIKELNERPIDSISRLQIKEISEFLLMYIDDIIHKNILKENVNEDALLNRSEGLLRDYITQVNKKKGKKIRISPRFIDNRIEKTRKRAKPKINFDDHAREEASNNAHENNTGSVYDKYEHLNIDADGNTEEDPYNTYKTGDNISYDTKIKWRIIISFVSFIMVAIVLDKIYRSYIYTEKINSLTNSKSQTQVAENVDKYDAESQSIDSTYSSKDSLSNIYPEQDSLGSIYNDERADTSTRAPGLYIIQDVVKCQMITVNIIEVVPFIKNKHTVEDGFYYKVSDIADVFSFHKDLPKGTRLNHNLVGLCE